MRPRRPRHVDTDAQIARRPLAINNLWRINGRDRGDVPGERSRDTLGDAAK